MSDLEARIAEVLAGHQLVGISLHKDAHCTGSGCGWTPTSSFLFPTADHRTHLAAMLAPVIAEAQAEAWDVGYMRGHYPWGTESQGEDPIPGYLSPPKTGRNRNPYRSNDE